MLARFFIDRPIFAWVISIVIMLVGRRGGRHAADRAVSRDHAADGAGDLHYPGASAKVVADTVAAPIEQQVNGVENMLYMSSQCTNDGGYNLTVTFEVGTNLDMAQVLVQNRVTLALPPLPERSASAGRQRRRRSRPTSCWSSTSSRPTARYDELYLSNYATIQISDELARIKGVGDVTYLGQRDYSMRVWLDPEKMAARDLTASDVVQRRSRTRTCRSPPGRSAAPPVPAGQEFQYTLSTLGRLTSPSSSATSSSRPSQGDAEQGRTVAARSCGCATSPASSSAPSSTTRSAASTASRRSAWPSSSCPAPTPCKRPTRSRPRWRS